jgi:transposase
MPTDTDPVSPTSPAAPLPIGEFAALIGLDWGDYEHVIVLRPRGPAPVETTRLKHSAESLHAWLKELGERFNHQPVAVAVEATKGAIVAGLLEYPWLFIYPIHPTTSRRFSTAFTPSGAKDDLPDALVLLDVLTHHRDRLRLMVVQEQSTRRVSLLVEARRKLIDRRTLLTNQLTSLLKNYYPQALSLVGDVLYAPLALDFLDRWPELEELKRARPQTLRGFYNGHQVRRKEVIDARLALIEKACALSADRALCEVSILQLRAICAEIRTLNTHLGKAEKAIKTAFAEHPDAGIFLSLPGAGEVLAPRLCALFGVDRERWPSAKDLQTYYGIAPVSEGTGTGNRCRHWRWNAPKFSRQSLVEWAGQTVRVCPWAKAYYLQQKSKQKGHSSILRSLAFKWLRVIWRCWHDHKPYDEALYMRQLTDRKAPLLAFLPKPEAK